MKISARAQRQLTAQRDMGPLFVKTGLAVLLVLGIVLVMGGILGGRTFQASGFDTETGYSYIHSMTGALETRYQRDIAPALEALDEESRAAVTQKLGEMLTAYWAQTRATDEASAEEELDAFLNSLPEEEREQAVYELFDIAFAVDGPRVSSSIKKELAALDASERAQLRQALLLALTDPDAPLPQTAQSAVEEMEGAEREQMLVQLFLISAQPSNETLPEDLANGMKKAIRDDNARLNAYKSAVIGEVGFVEQFVISNSRTVILFGVLLVLDMLLMMFLLGTEHSWRVDVKWIIILLIIDFMLVFQLLPLVYLVVKAFWPEGTFTLETFRRLYTYAMNWSALKNTLIAATATMVLGTLLAFPLAWLVGRTNLYGKKFFRSLFVLTYMVPPYVGAMAWLRLLNPNVGTINTVLRAIFGLSESTGPLNIYSLGGMIWVLTTFYYPYAFITISRAMEKMDPSLEEASRISGASPIKTVLTVTLPMMTPSLIAGALLVFVCAASCYGIPSIIGAPGKVHTVTTRIIEYYGLGTQGLNDATGLAVFLMVMAIIILYVSDFVVAKRQYITVSGKSTRPNIVDLRRWRVPLTCLVSLFAVIVILIPFATILTTSFKVDVGKKLFDPGNFTFGQWTLIFSRSETLSCLKNSLIFGGVTATVGIVIACAMSYLLQRTRIRGRKIPDFLITLGSGTPSVVIALGLIMTMKGNFGVNIYNTAYIMIVAYLIKYLMMGMRTVVSAMSQIHVSLEECSQISGASWLRTMRKVTGPLIFPSIAAGWFLIFIPSFYELSMTTLLYSNSTKTIGFQLYEYWTYTSQPQSCAMAFGILMIVVLLNFVLNRLTKGEFSI